MTDIINIQSGFTNTIDDITDIFTQKLAGDKAIKEDKSITISLMYSLYIRANGYLLGDKRFNKCVISPMTRCCHVLFHNYNGWCGTGSSTIYFTFYSSGKMYMKADSWSEYKLINDFVIIDDTIRVTLTNDADINYMKQHR